MPLSRQGRERLDRFYALCESNRGRLQPRRSPFIDAFRIEPRPRSFAVPQPLSYRKAGMVTGALLVLLALVGLASQLGSREPAQTNLVSTILPAVDSMPIASGAGGNSSVAGDLGAPAPSDLTPSAQGVVPAAAPASVTGSRPIGSHAVFGFVTDGALADSAGIDLSGLTTVDYFAIGINPDGSLGTSSAGAQGYESQNFVDLVDRAHAAGERVVVTLDDFSQSSLDQLAASATAPQTLANSVLFLVKARGLDGVNLDLEGQGSGDQSGITNLVKVVSQTLKAANPDSQLTMDTYASSAGDAGGFFDITALSPYVDGFFVMAYQLNLRAAPSGQSVLTSSMFSNQTALNQYTSAIPPSKVLLGMPSFGYDWPTTAGTLDAVPAGGPTIVTYEQEAQSGHPIYWDPVTDTAWTSYEVGSQWHEAFFENPTSLSMAARLAKENGIAGVGFWTLGMNGPSDAPMIAALEGKAPTPQQMRTGPASTSVSPGLPKVAARRGSSIAAPQARSTTPKTPAGSSTTTSTTSTSQPAAVAQPVSYTYGGDFQGAGTRVLPSAPPSGPSTLEGTMTEFVTADPKLDCLDKAPLLDVYHYADDPADDYVIAQTSIGDCVDGAFMFELAAPAAAPAPAPPVPYSYAGTWDGAQTRLLGTAPPTGQSSVLGTMTDFTTLDPSLTCLASEPGLDVYHFAADPTHDYVIAAKTSGDCADAAFIFTPATP